MGGESYRASARIGLVFLCNTSPISTEAVRLRFVTGMLLADKLSLNTLSSEKALEHRHLRLNVRDCQPDFFSNRLASAEEVRQVHDRLEAITDFSLDRFIGSCAPWRTLASFYNRRGFQIIRSHIHLGAENLVR